MRYVTHLIIFSLLACLILSGCTSGRRAFSKGENFESDGKYDEAMYSYAEAFRNDPDTGEYRLRFFKAREKAADMHYKQGNKLFEQGNYAAALAEFQAGLGIDPTQGRFEQLIEKAVRLKEAQQAYQEGLEFEKANKFKDANRVLARALELDPKNKEYQAAQARVLGLRKNKLEGFELSLKSAKPITLKFKDAKIKDVFNIVTRLSGINFIFDEGVKDQPVTIYIENATFQQVLDLLTNMFKLGRKIANESTVIIYPRTPEKIKQYEDMTIRTFNLNYMEAKKAINLIRTLLQVRKIYVNEESNAIVVRDTSDVVAVVEKILDANDVPDAEVILEVEVLEIGDTDGKTVGLLLSPYNVQMGAYNSAGDLMATTLQSATTSSTTTTTTTTDTSVAKLISAFAMKGYTGFVTVPNAQFDFAKTLGKAEVLSNPKIRIKNREKAKFNVGTRVPITTTNTTNTTVSVNVQYIDVGVKLSAEPNIQPNNEVVIKLGMEVSQQVGAAKTVGGSDSATTVVTIGTRNLDTVLSLKDGETSVIGGLLERTGSNDKKKIFLLSDIPWFGELLTNTTSSNSKTELILAITPRLVRRVTVPQSSLASFVSGKEDDPALSRSLASFDEEPLFESEQKPVVKQLVPQIPGTQSPVPQTGQPQAAIPQQEMPRQASPLPVVPQEPVPQSTVPQPVVPQRMTPQTDSSSQTAPKMTTPPQPMPATSSQTGASAQTPLTASQPVASQNATAPVQRGFLRINAPASATVGKQFTLEVKATSIGDLNAAPFVLTYDPALVEFVSVGEGGFLKKDGVSTIFGSAVSAATGAVSINLARGPGSVGVSGDGTLASLVFRAKQKGLSSFGFSNVGFSASDGKPLTVLPFSSAVEIR
jgi:general secretion pathway protein D